ncbi:hypothetical protein AVEN_202506-1 [Araneus ventricosus]|uniref:Uncharacterized protein n=1 Tax=Araneus ventricosus TaxID=182803 RepID=A0A4Y2M2N8_ARAVE|nr:hypothetical protein AVEN_202506-1 [Araneus ventricosus]
MSKRIDSRNFSIMAMQGLIQLGLPRRKLTSFGGSFFNIRLTAHRFIMRLLPLLLKIPKLVVHRRSHFVKIYHLFGPLTAGLGRQALRY